MAKILKTLYPGKTDVDVNNPNGTFKNRTSDILKDGTPFEKGWASDIWGFLSHILKKESVTPNGAEENETNTKDLIINVTSSTTVIAKAKRLSILDSNNIPVYDDDLDLTFSMPADLEVGTSEKNTAWYGAWYDSDGNKRLVPDLTGTTTGTTAGKLIDAGATFLTDLVHQGDIVYNLTTKAKTTASADATLNGEISVTDDIFTSGDNYKIEKISPEGLGNNRVRLGSFYNNGSGDFDDSYYTQIQDEKFYSEAAGDFAVTGSNWTTSIAEANIKQVNDWTGQGTWMIDAGIIGAISAGSANTFSTSISGLLFDAADRQSINLTDFAAQARLASEYGYGWVSAGTNIIVAGFATVVLLTSNDWGFRVIVKLDKKPTFHN
jgi:hypothetical protein